MTETAQQAARRLARSTIRGDFKPEALHCYTDEKGEPIYWRIRARLADGEKWIRPMRRNGNGCELGEPDFPCGKPLYRLHELAVKHGAPCWYVEGESCADALANLGLLATTAGGARSDERADFSPLKGRAVTIWPDNDKRGTEHAERVAAKLRLLGCNVEVLDVAALGLPEKGDCVNWLIAHPGARAADLAALPRTRTAGTTGTLATPAKSQAWPEKLDDAAYCGLAGEIVKAIEPGTESDPAAILLQVLVAFGALVGRGPHVPVEGDQHHANLFALIVGETSKARKGTSWGRVREIVSRAVDWPHVVDGLSSGEGLKWAVRDRITKAERDKRGVAQEVETDPGVTDKRLLVVEAEFAQVLRQGARAGNTLSATIRSAWDSGNLRTLTRNDPITATGAHVCIIGHITADELRAELTATDSANGFANRFLFMCARRSKSLPFGGDPINPDVRESFARRIGKAVDGARRLGAIGMAPSAREAWSAIYARLSEGYPGLFGAVTGRAEAQCLRLALAYALMDGRNEVGREHLLAALAIWERAEASARWIFGDSLGDPIADQVLDALRAARPDTITRTGISKVLGKHQTAERIGAALALLERRGLARRESVRTEGAPAEHWQAA